MPTVQVPLVPEVYVPTVPDADVPIVALHVFVANVAWHNSHSTGTAEAVTPSNDSRHLMRSAPKLLGASTPRTDLAVAADKLTAPSVVVE